MNQYAQEKYIMSNIKSYMNTKVIINEGFFQKAWDFVDSDEGAAALIYYFKKDVKIPDASIFKKRAPETEDLKILIEQNKHPLQKKLEYDLTRPDEEKKKIRNAMDRLKQSAVDAGIGWKKKASRGFRKGQQKAEIKKGVEDKLANVPKDVQ